MYMKKIGEKRVVFNVSDDLLAWLERYSKHTGATRAVIVRRALEDFVLAAERTIQIDHTDHSDEYHRARGFKCLDSKV